MLPSTFAFIGLTMLVGKAHAALGAACTATFPPTATERCCNSLVIDPTTALCCQDTTVILSVNQNIDNLECCGTEAADIGRCCGSAVLETDDQCCMGNKITKTAENACCNERVLYNPMEKKCCGPYLLPLPSGVNNEEDRDCCVDKPTGRPDRFFPRMFDPDTEACCRGQVQALDSSIAPATLMCCANRQYDPTMKRCCRNRLFPTDTTSPRCRGL